MFKYNNCDIVILVSGLKNKERQKSEKYFIINICVLWTKSLGTSIKGKPRDKREATRICFSGGNKRRNHRADKEKERLLEENIGDKK